VWSLAQAAEEMGLILPRRTTEEIARDKEIIARRLLVSYDWEFPSNESIREAVRCFFTGAYLADELHA